MRLRIAVSYRTGPGGRKACRNPDPRLEIRQREHGAVLERLERVVEARALGREAVEAGAGEGAELVPRDSS